MAIARRPFALWDADSTIEAVANTMREIDEVASCEKGCTERL